MTYLASGTAGLTASTSVRLRYQGFDANGCATVPVFTDIVVDPDFTVTAQPVIQVCEDMLGSGSATVNLETYNDSIEISGDPLVDIFWYNGDPNLGGNQLSSTAAQNATLGIDGILQGELFAVISRGICSEIVPITYTINALPSAPVVSVVSADCGVDGSAMIVCLLYTSPSPRDATLSRMPSSA